LTHSHPLPHLHLGMTWSTRCAAVCDIHRAPHEGQKPRRLQLNSADVRLLAICGPAGH
jgi:hypothetical protein